MIARHPPPYPTSGPALREATEVEFYVAGGPGGQHRNKTETGVRLHHGPSGVIVTATERRSRAANLDAAWERLRERLEKLNFVPKRRRATRPTKGSKERRLGEKKRDARIKADRKAPRDD
jgi:protein subunit release factor B